MSRQTKGEEMEAKQEAGPNLFRDQDGHVCIRREQPDGTVQSWPIIDNNFSLFDDAEKSALVSAWNSHEKAKSAIAAILRRIKRDPRVAYYFDPITDCYEKLVSAHCELNGLDEAQFRKEFESGLRFESPEETISKAGVA